MHMEITAIELFSWKLQVNNLYPAILQKRTPLQWFFSEFSKSFQNAYFAEHLRTTASEVGSCLTPLNSTNNL